MARASATVWSLMDNKDSNAAKLIETRVRARVPIGVWTGSIALCVHKVTSPQCGEAVEIMLVEQMCVVFACQRAQKNKVAKRLHTHTHIHTHTTHERTHMHSRTDTHTHTHSTLMLS